MSKKTSKNGASTWCGRGRGFVTVVAAIAAVPLMKTAFAEAQATTTVSSSGDMDNTGSARLNVTRTENRRLYHIDVTEKGEPCLDNPILERIIDPTTYEYGCRDIQVSMDAVVKSRRPHVVLNLLRGNLQLIVLFPITRN